MASASLIDETSKALQPAPLVRVLHIVNGEFYAGAERVQDLLALRLPEFGFEAGFACIKPDKFPAMRQSRTPLCLLPMRSKWDLRAARDVARLICREGYALVHAHTPRSLLVGRLAAVLAGVPLVYHMHSQTTTEVNGGWTCRLNAWTERCCLFGAAAVIAVSPSAREFARRQGIPERLIRVVPNGIPTPPHSTEREPPRAEWTLGTVALFRPRKGLEVLLASLAQLRRAGRPVRLRAVGPFETAAYEQEMHRLVRRLDLQDAVDWTGFSQDVNAELARMDLFVFPSILPEGSPMVLLEAMSAGVPIVASRVEGVTDVVGDDLSGGDRAALLVPPSDSQTLAETITEVMNGKHDWGVLRSAARRRLAEQFLDRSMAEGVARVYREVLR